MAAMRQKEEAEREKEMESERKKDLAGGSEVVDQKYKALEYLLNQSKLFSAIMLQQMTQQEEAASAEDEKQRKKAEKQDERAEKVAHETQLRVTRGSAAQTDPTSKQRPKRATRSRAKKAVNGKISDHFNKSDLEAKAGQATVSEALAEEAGGDVKSGGVGIQQLRSAKQPALVTGGIMRKYQLEGLDWLTSLYENGLNGILADEMGLGKTIQTISFLAFLREKGVNGPFLIAAPLSTTSNWVAEFKKWAPDIPVVLYHGTKPQREEIRRKRLRNPSSPSFPVVCTSYEICMNDRKYLAAFGWKFIIIDEGHRIKNLNCKLIRELQSYQSANRLLITGTPLQNNLSELWSLLHFLMPTIFDKLESFESWFDFSALKDKQGYEQILSEERKTNLVTSLHAILKPFLLRRVKSDVETSLPKKREYVLYAPLVPAQRELYESLLNGTSREYLEDKLIECMGGKKRKASALITPGPSGASTPTDQRGKRSVKRRKYEEISDETYFQRLEDSSHTDSNEDTIPPSVTKQQKFEALAKKEISTKKLLNPAMQLRQCCNSPYNFYNPFRDDIIDERLVTSSGKMMLLDRLLPALLTSGHKVLIFSQFKSQLDLIESYCNDLRGWETCRIDGSMSQIERTEQIAAFNATDNNTHNIFLLSTRAGGQGINLAAADTVLLFDSDWNPQQDLQAQDRAHRIGQTRPVIVYRFATKNTVEQLLLDKADGKRRLEKLVIQKGGINRSATGGEGDMFVELKNLLAKDDGQRLDVGNLLSERDLKIITDRSPEAYESMETGEGFQRVETGRQEGLLEGLNR
ncbi:hypothetical protein K470DRAFT_217030 [Piedraia hortae CBS 480.64]|uniref:SWI/SNF chromatin remodeling complex component n=1 Tax=Piedraia hortae CBS 480.64 TaxID=1314780 RepID=A0A6A7BZ14_9PEZI|nr:hypothetical protein K470DRAFT_217030 [Piedraia hortae CBS 480.64]